MTKDLRIFDGMTEQERFWAICETVCDWNRIESAINENRFFALIGGEWEHIGSIRDLAELLQVDIDVNYIVDVVFGCNL
jgi:hypothetical protein